MSPATYKSRVLQLWCFMVLFFTRSRCIVQGKVLGLQKGAVGFPVVYSQGPDPLVHNTLPHRSSRSPRSRWRCQHAAYEQQRALQPTKIHRQKLTRFDVRRRVLLRRAKPGLGWNLLLPLSRKSSTMHGSKSFWMQNSLAAKSDWGWDFMRHKWSLINQQ